MQFEDSIIAYKIIIWCLSPVLIVTEIINYVIWLPQQITGNLELILICL